MIRVKLLFKVLTYILFRLTLRFSIWLLPFLTLFRFTRRTRRIVLSLVVRLLLRVTSQQVLLFGLTLPELSWTKLVVIR